MSEFLTAMQKYSVTTKVSSAKTVAGLTQTAPLWHDRQRQMTLAYKWREREIYKWR